MAALGACFLGVALLSQGACKGQAEVVNHCLEPDAGCPPCSSPGECRFTGNRCLSTVHCTHVSVPLAFPEIGCDPISEASWPDPEECACRGSVCRYDE